MKSSIVMILLLVLIAMVTVGCGSAAPEPPPVPTEHPGKALVSSHCTTCHDLNRVENYRGDAESWGMTVDRMISSGATLNEEQRDLVVDYLASSYPE